MRRSAGADAGRPADGPIALSESRPMELKNLSQFERASRRGRNDSFRLGVGMVFVVCIMLYTGLTQGMQGPHGVMLVAAAIIGGYMAMNIGANDVANNLGPAVGSKAVSMVGALVIAAVFEAAGALIAGGDVVRRSRRASSVPMRSRILTASSG